MEMGQALRKSPCKKRFKDRIHLVSERSKSALRPMFIKNVPKSMSHESKLNQRYENRNVKKRSQDTIQLVSRRSKSALGTSTKLNLFHEFQSTLRTYFYENVPRSMLHERKLNKD